MPDTALLVKRYLGQDAALLALVPGGAALVAGKQPDPNQHIYQGELPDRADPNTYAPFITVSGDGGRGHSEAPIVADRVRVRVWAGINQVDLARQVYNEVFNWLHRKNMIDLAPDGFIVSSQEAVRGQDLTDPDTSWATVLAYYEITARDSA